MNEKLTALQWNIGGGLLPRPDADITLSSSFTIDGFHHIAELLNQEQPDIVTFQETHESIFPQLAERLGYEYWFNDIYSPSHITAGQHLGLAVLSRFPISNHSYEQFYNPKLTMPWEDGSEVVSDNKGTARCRIEVTPSMSVGVQTLHVLPFRRFGIAPLSERGKPVIDDVAAKLQPSKPSLIQGDFNINDESLKDYFPSLFQAGVNEVLATTPTTPKGRRYDHVLYRGLKLISSKTIDTVLTDHYPVVSTFEVDS